MTHRPGQSARSVSLAARPLSLLLLLSAAVAEPGRGGRIQASTVAFRLSSPQNGQTLAPGTRIEWSVEASASSGDNAGLALAVLDLVQSVDNPALLDLPPSSGVPEGMETFSRPLGISNPGEGGGETGYIGVQRGVPGSRNLVQIGGAQNTTGISGLLQGQSTLVTPGVGQGEFILIARGSFIAPPASGAYVYRMSNAVANTLVEAREAPAASLTESANVALELASFTFTVQSATPRCALGCFVRGDCNGDGRATGSVTDAVFLLAYNFLGGPEPPCLAACDVNGDGMATGGVTDAVALLQFNFLGGLPPPAPFPQCGESTRPSDAQLGCNRSQEVCQ